MAAIATYTREQAQAYPRPKTVKYTTRNTSRTRAVAQPPGRNLQCTLESEGALFYTAWNLQGGHSRHSTTNKGGATSAK